MSIQQSGFNAYANALSNFQSAHSGIDSFEATHMNQAAAPTNSFAETLSNSLSAVNGLQAEKNHAVASFASGESQNVHELMITLQKASVAVNMTAAVRNKVLEGYRELSKLQF